MPHDDVTLLARLAIGRAAIVKQLETVVLGQTAVIEQLLITLFAGGHGLVVGVPGLAKTLLVRSLAAVLDCSFRRIQFTPDLMPSDITGTDVIQEDRQRGTREFRFLAGPVFANILLADEINRSPPKTQAALLEAMQEHQVTAGGTRHPLPEPFFVLATQNPIEQEGTYALPEAQLDRFLMRIDIGYPEAADELRMIQQTTGETVPALRQVVAAEDVVGFLGLVRRVPIAESIAHYALRLVRATRAEAPEAPERIRRYVRYGAGPRGGQGLVLAGKARAALDGRTCVTMQDIQAVTLPVLRHRLQLGYAAEAERVRADDLICEILDTIPFDEPTRDPIRRSGVL